MAGTPGRFQESSGNSGQSEHSFRPRPGTLRCRQSVPGLSRLSAAPDVKMASAPMPGGYFVETAIPWKVLGVAPRAGLKLRGDVGVLFADSGGTETVARHYWSNKATGLVNDVPGEADLSPNLWGT